jgi:hypothetical protein
MALPMHDLAAACGVWLLHRLDAQGDQETAASPFASVSPGALVLRGSTAAPGRSTRRV